MTTHTSSERLLTAAGEARVARRVTPRGIVGVRAMLLAAVLTIPACQTAQEALRDVEIQQNDLTRRMQEAILRCQGNQQCINDVRETYRKLNEQYEELRLQILRENWDDARKLRDKLIELLKELVKKFPELQTFLEELLRQKEKDEKGTGDGKIDALPKSVGGNGNSSFGPGAGGSSTNGPAQSGPNPTLPTTEYVVSGSFNFDTAPFAGNHSVDGTLNISGVRTSAGFTGKVLSGSLTVGSGGVGIPFPIDTVHAASFPSTVKTNAAGVGTIHLVLRTDAITVPPNPATAVLGPITAVSLPITMDASGAISFNFPSGPLSPLFPHTNYPASDYDANGVLNQSADFAAFMAGFGAHEIRADVTLDGIWDSADIDRWIVQFQEDESHQ